MANTMNGEESRMQESSDVKRMSQSATFRDDIAVLAGPYQASDTRESWLSRAARKAKISFRQAKALWYGECTDPKYSIAVSVRSAADQARLEARELAARFETIAGGLNAQDQDFHSDTIVALIEQARRLRGLDRPGD